MKQLINGLQHIGIPTNDLQKAIDFYQSIGFETKLLTQTPREKVAFMELQSLMLELYENKQATEKPGAIDHIALDVNNIQAVYEKIQTLGYRVIEGDIQFLPFWDHGVRYFTILSPESVKVEFSQKL